MSEEIKNTQSGRSPLSLSLNGVPLNKMSKEQILKEIEKRTKRVYGDLFSPESKSYKEIKSRLSAQPKDKLIAILRTYQGIDINKRAKKIQKLTTELNKLVKDYDKERILCIETEKKWASYNTDFEKLCVKYFGKNFSGLRNEYAESEGSIFLRKQKPEVLSWGYNKYQISKTDQIEPYKLLKNIEKLKEYSSDYNDKMYNMKKAILQLDNIISKEIVEIAKLDDYSALLPAETRKILEGIKFAEPGDDIRKIHESGYTGKGVTIVFIDTGIVPHPDFQGRIKVFKDFTKKGKDSPSDNAGHGTHVAGIAAGSGKVSGGRFKGVAPEADIIALKIYNPYGGLDDDSLYKAFKWINENKDKYNIQIVNVSMEITKNDFKEAGPEAEKIVNSGIICFAGVGNDGEFSDFHNPLVDIAGFIAVGSSNQIFNLRDDDDSISVFSSGGAKSVLFAPGEKIIAPLAPDSAMAHFDQEYSIDMDSDGKEDYIYESGTSMATPYISGLAALMRQANPRLTAKEIRQILIDTATPLKNIPAPTQGLGIVNPRKAMEKALLLKKE